MCLSNLFNSIRAQLSSLHSSTALHVKSVRRGASIPFGRVPGPRPSRPQPRADRVPPRFPRALFALLRSGPRAAPLVPCQQRGVRCCRPDAQSPPERQRLPAPAVSALAVGRWARGTGTGTEPGTGTGTSPRTGGSGLHRYAHAPNGSGEFLGAGYALQRERARKIPVYLPCCAVNTR